MAFTRDAYEAVGGYEAVAGDVVDDMAMCMATKAAGSARGVCLGHGDRQDADVRILGRCLGGLEEQAEGLHENLALARWSRCTSPPLCCRGRAWAPSGCGACPARWRWRP